jgi:hypothetical protein
MKNEEFHSPVGRNMDNRMQGKAAAYGKKRKL